MNDRMTEGLAAFWKALMQLARRIVSLLAKPFSLRITDERWGVLEQFIKFVLVGCSNVAITLSVYYLVLWVRPTWYLFGNTIGYLAGILNSFFWNCRVVFTENNSPRVIVFGKMLLCYGLTWFLQTGLLYLFVEHCGISKIVTPLLTVLITTPINFVLNKIWAFHQKKGDDRT